MNNPIDEIPEEFGLLHIRELIRETNRKYGTKVEIVN